MIDNGFDAVTRQAADLVSRRSSLLALGGAAVAAVAAPAVTSAGKVGKTARKRCKKQAQRCRAAFAVTCANELDPELCRATMTPCCEPLSRCDAGPAVACVFANV